MDPHQPQKCKWEGCCSYDVVFGGIYCQDHKRQYLQSRPPQSNKSHAFPSSSSNPPTSLSKNSTAIQSDNRVNENGSLNSFYSSGVSLPTNEKKQLPDKHVARKSTKQPATLGRTHVSPTPSVQRPSTEAPSANSRPVKRQRVSGVPNLSELHPRSNSSSFSDNSIPPSSKRGMFRQSEERTPKLSAVEDFALRPKKKEAATESARPKAYNDQRPSYRGEGLPSGTSRQTPTSSKPPQSIGLNGFARYGSFVIDLTGDDSEPPLPRPKPQLSPKSFIPNGTTVMGHQKPKRPPDGNPHLPHEQRNVVALGNKQGREGPNQSGGISPAEHKPSIEQISRNLHAQGSPQNIISSAPTVQAPSKLANGTSSELPKNRQRLNEPVLNSGLGAVHMGSSGTTHSYEPPSIEQRQLTNGTHQVSLEKSSVALNPSLGTSETEKTVIRDSSESSVQATPIPTTPMTPRLRATKAATTRQNHETQPPTPNLQPAALLSTKNDKSPTIISQGPLSALLGGREWEKMSPEERRQFWVSQHDPKIFDAQIYSENNRPFRPGDALFGLADDMLPSRPTRIATHFDYIDPRSRYSHQRSEEWYQKKQKEISARGNRKRNLGEAVKRAVQRKRTAPIPNERQKRDRLPQRVRDNPKWLGALEVLEKLEAQARDKRRNKLSRKNNTKDTAPITIDTMLDCDADMESG
ncbi:hypothetical protein F5Y09DRAFT_342380 [Xylaria sp. FL1042]|nr:hypothetical protein F5Y09DRAFT_342380 [Xylaria sp. FL1042]